MDSMESYRPRRLLPLLNPSLPLKIFVPRETTFPENERKITAFPETGRARRGKPNSSHSAKVKEHSGRQRSCAYGVWSWPRCFFWPSSIQFLWVFHIGLGCVLLFFSFLGRSVFSVLPLNLVFSESEIF